MNSTSESEKNVSAPEVPQTKTKRAPAKKAKPAKKAGRAKKPATKPKVDRASKKAEVIALMKRAKGATLAEIIAAICARFCLVYKKDPNPPIALVPMLG